MAGACLLSNTLLDDEEDGPEQFCQFGSEDALLELALMLKDGHYNGLPLWEVQGHDFYQEIMADHLPVNRAEQIINFINMVRNDKT